ncbi:MAG: polysaccharide biosynthesis/export family protein [Prevotellaceae bacterium]|jgi:polysaccharide export outer membrane protein|nr:polysaccharide biosynthesis/export family protein [Prevotellaceae bacterium]
MKLKYILFLLLTIGLSSCYTRYSSNLLQERKNLPQYQKNVYEEYKLRVNDELVMRVITEDEGLKVIFSSSGNGDNAFSYRVYDDGTVDFPFLPKMYLAGKTLEEAENILREHFLDFANDVRIKLALKTNTFCVIGDAGRGYFPIYKERLTIYQALALSGGINESAVLSKVKIIRTSDTGTVIKSFDIRSKSIIDSEFYYIQPNDIIYCDLSKKKFWASGSYAEFTGFITTSVTFLLTVWNMIEK